MSSPFDIIAIITPKPSKADRVRFLSHYTLSSLKHDLMPVRSRNSSTQPQLKSRRRSPTRCDTTYSAKSRAMRRSS